MDTITIETIKTLDPKVSYGTLNKVIESKDYDLFIAFCIYHPEFIAESNDTIFRYTKLLEIALENDVNFKNAYQSHELKGYGKRGIWLDILDRLSYLTDFDDNFEFMDSDLFYLDEVIPKLKNQGFDINEKIDGPNILEDLILSAVSDYRGFLKNGLLKELLEIYMKHGAKIDQPINNSIEFRDSLLHIFIQEMWENINLFNSSIFNFIIDDVIGQNLNLQAGKNKITVLHLAVLNFGYGEYDCEKDKDILNVVRIMLERGADPNSYDNDKQTPLSRLTNRKSINPVLKSKLIILLIEYGADTSLLVGKDNIKIIDKLNKMTEY